MKVLYISEAKGADYQCDMLFHGLRSLLGPDVVDVNKIHFLYQGTPYPPFYTIYGLLPEIAVDRDDISSKIRNYFFDLIVYGSIHRCKFFWDEVAAAYPMNRIFLIDGEDDWNVSPEYGKGIYFKREMCDNLTTHPEGIRPIQFAIPKEKIWQQDTQKIRLMAPCDPRDRSTYIYYGDESKYYQQYAESYFGFTMKKGGWDCCRHYEIIAAGCLPYFIDIEKCPTRTLTQFDKMDLQRVRLMADSSGFDGCMGSEYWKWLKAFRKVLDERLTTEALAKRVLEAAC